ncbi:MAG TPA: amidohydrolase family protein [Bacteroidales bacterium]|jgi:hypothetical protein|nr:amidohydrolase family protein [Bacteroidales bacterium]
MKNILSIFIMAALFSMGCRNQFYTEKDYSSVKKIDAHIHVDADDGAVEKLAEDNNFVLLTLNVDHTDSAAVKEQFHHAVNSLKNYPGQIIYGATFWFDTTGFRTDAWSEKTISQLEENLSGGAVCVKVWKNIGMVLKDREGKFIMIDDPGLDKVFSYLKSKHVPVNGHLGEPRNCWLPLDQMTVSSDSNYFAQNPQYHMFLHPEFPSYEDQIRARDNLLKKNPDMIFVGSHLASLEWSVDSLAAWFDKFPNAAADVSARTCHLQYQTAKDREKVRNFIIKYQDRLLYGTDVGYHGSNTEAFTKDLQQRWLDEWKYFTSDEEMTAPEFRGKFQGLQLQKEVVDKLYYGNAVKWYNLKLN